MRKDSVIIWVILAVVLVGGGAYFYQQNQSQKEKAMMEEKKMKQGAAMKDNKKMADDKVVADKSASRYVEYSKSVLDHAVEKRRVLYFYASWCPICRPADADFRKNSSKIPEDMVVVRVNYNDPDTDQEEKDLAKKYDIIYQHTFVQIDGQGKEIAKWNGGQTSELLANIK